MPDRGRHPVKPIHRHIAKFWSEDRSLTAFLILLIAEIFVIAPINRTGLALGLVNNILFSLLLLVGLLTMTRHKALQAVRDDVRCPGRRNTLGTSRFRRIGP